MLLIVAYVYGWMFVIPGSICKFVGGVTWIHVLYMLIAVLVSWADYKILSLMYNIF